METDKTNIKILKILLKDLTIKPTITSLAKEVGMTRVGVWKVLKKLEKDKLVVLSPVGIGKTSTYNISLNWGNMLVEKTLSLALTEDASRKQRWRVNFAEIENKVKFLILFGSILGNSKEANDIDILAIVNKKNFKAVEETIAKAQQTQIKKIHLIDLTADEFSQELKKPNKAYINAVKKGIVLYGQDNFIQFIRGLQK